MQLSVLMVVSVVVCVTDKVVRTLGEGTFGKVVECLDLVRSVCVNISLSLSLSLSVNVGQILIAIGTEFKCLTSAN